MFAVDDIDDTLARLGRHGAALVGKVTQYEDMYRLCYIRGPEGILIGLAKQHPQPMWFNPPGFSKGIRYLGIDFLRAKLFQSCLCIRRAATCDGEY